MKKLAISLFLAAGAMALFGCNARSQYVEQPLKPMAQSFQGVLPCADCQGVDTSLFLEKDGTFVLKEVYRGTRDGDQAFAEYGSWQRTADKLVLTGTDGSKRYFRPKGNDLNMLDASGNDIDSTLNYTLKATDAPLPVTPMTFKGMYVYMADAATFHDCATGKNFPVSNNIALEQGYSRAQGEAGQPVFLEIQAHFAITPSMEDGMVEKAIVPDGQPRFDAKGDCAN